MIRKTLIANRELISNRGIINKGEKVLIINETWNKFIKDFKVRVETEKGLIMLCNKKDFKEV